MMEGERWDVLYCAGRVIFVYVVGPSKYSAPSDAVHPSLRSLEQTSVVARLFGAFRDLALWQPLLDPCRAMKRRVRWA